jgi:hypothetical protein
MAKPSKVYGLNGTLNRVELTTDTMSLPSRTMKEPERHVRFYFKLYYGGYAEYSFSFSADRIPVIIQMLTEIAEGGD